MGATSRDFITAVGKIGDKLVIMIDVDKILSIEEMSKMANSPEMGEKEPALGATEDVVPTTSDVTNISYLNGGEECLKT